MTDQPANTEAEKIAVWLVDQADHWTGNRRARFALYDVADRIKSGGYNFPRTLPPLPPEDDGVNDPTEMALIGSIVGWLERQIASSRADGLRDGYQTDREFTRIDANRRYARRLIQGLLDGDYLRGGFPKDGENVLTTIGPSTAA